MDERWVYLLDPIRYQPIFLKKPIIQSKFKPIMSPNPNKSMGTHKEYDIFISNDDAEQEWIDRLHSGIVF
jgi:hypothetical protein